MHRLFLISVAGIVSLPAQPAGSEVIRGTGGPMALDLGYGIQVNEGSTLDREWVVVTDQGLPAKLTSFAATTNARGGNWYYDIDYVVEIGEDIQALEVRFIPFDIWGDSGTTLSATDIQDLSVANHDFSARWRVRSDSDAQHHYAMLGYVAQVKLASGAILRANPDVVVEEARKFSEDFSSDDLSTDR